MTLKRLKMMWQLILITSLGLMGGTAIAAAASPAAPLPDGNLEWFLDAATNQDSGEPPRTKRGDDVCWVTLPLGTVSPMLSDRPVFLMQGQPRRLAVYTTDASQPLWQYPVNEAVAVTYDGPPLQPGVVYTLRAAHPRFATTIYEERQFTILNADEQAAIATALSDRTADLQQAGATTTAIVQAQARYLGEQGLLTDMWVILLPLQATVPEVDAAITAAYTALCED